MTFSDFLKWRVWVALFGPTLLAFGTNYLMGESLLGLALAATFVFTVGTSFTKYMARAQTRADFRVKLRHLQAEFHEVTELLDALPHEERLPYVEGYQLMALRIRALQEVLESKK